MKADMQKYILLTRSCSIRLQKEQYTRRDMIMAVVMQSYHRLRDISINPAKVQNFIVKNSCQVIMQGSVPVLQSKMILLQWYIQITANVVYQITEPAVELIINGNKY